MDSEEKTTELSDKGGKDKMMKKLIKKITAMILAGVMAANAGTAAFAESESTNDSLGIYLNEALPQILSEENVNILDTIREYASQTIPYYLPTFELYGEYDISEPIQIHNWDGGADTEKYLVIVSKDNVMVGSLTAEYVENRAISAFREESIPEINAALASGAEIQLGYSNDCFLVYKENEFFIIDNPEFAETDFISSLSINQALSGIITKSAQSSASLQGRSITTYQTNPAVQNVSNDISPDILEGNEEAKALCWAACVASIGMQYQSLRGHTAMSVYLACRDSESSEKPSDTYPSGVKKWYTFAFKEIYDMDTVFVEKAMDENLIKNLLLSNRPILCRLRNSTNEDRKHAMVLFCYSNIDGSQGQYVFMDPGSRTKGAGRVSVKVDSALMADGTNLAITSRNGKDYNLWYGSGYRK